MWLGNYLRQLDTHNDQSIMHDYKDMRVTSPESLCLEMHHQNLQQAVEVVLSLNSSQQALSLSSALCFHLLSCSIVGVLYDAHKEGMFSMLASVITHW